MTLIIHHPEKQSTRQRWMIGVVTAAFWIFWIYLWIPFISLLAWIFGVRIFEYQMIELGGYQALLELLGIYFLIIVLLGGCLIAWAVYNIGRFGHASARHSSPVIDVGKQARHFNVDVQQLEQWRKSQKLTIEHGDDSQITRVSTG